MIGSDLSDLVTQLQPGTTFFHSESLSHDEWLGRDRVLQWLWDNYGAAAAAAITPEPGLVNIIGPTYGCFNAPSDLHEVKRLIEGAGGRVNLVFPYEATLAQIADLAKASVNVVMYQEFGHTLAQTLGHDWLTAPIGIRATTEFVRQLGVLLGTSEQAEAFIRHEKKTTLQAVWDLWRGPQSDWFSTISVGIASTRTYVDGLSAYLGDELGMQIAFRGYRPRRAGEPGNEEVRRLLHTQPPSFVFGSINEKIYLAESGKRQTSFIPAAFPGPVVRRSVGTPFMGFRGAVHIIQDIVNMLYETLFTFLPLDSAYGQQNGGAPRPAANAASNLAWSQDAKAVLDAALEKMPFIARISASRELQMKVETAAQGRGLKEVDAALAEEILKS
jgi:chlorophyllide a reductase subunit Z